MPLTLRHLLKTCRLILASIKNNRWQGNFNDWDEARSHCIGGYSNGNIIDTVVNATRKVASGEAVFERDSVLFDHIQYSWPLATAINWAQVLHPEQLNVVDFGGALGSSFRQNTIFLSRHSQIKWIVVEQEAFVEIGKREFTTAQLCFENSLDDAISNYKPQLILAPSVLQYLEQPFLWLKKIANSNADIVFFDRTIVSIAEQNQLTIQTVPASIYPASYPCWALNEKELLDMMNEHYDLVSHEKIRDILIGTSISAKECHYLFKRKHP